MIVKLSPQFNTTKTIIEVIDENTIIYNGKTFDFSFLANGDEVQGSYPANGVITRDLNGILNIELVWAYNHTGTMADRFPAVVHITSGFIIPVEAADV